MATPLQPDRKIIVAGTVDRQFVVVRSNDDGSLYENFGIDGVTITPLPLQVPPSIHNVPFALSPDLALGRHLLVILSGDHKHTVQVFLRSGTR